MATVDVRRLHEAMDRRDHAGIYDVFVDAGVFPKLEPAPAPCVGVCLPQFGLHDISCDVRNRRDPILPRRFCEDRDPTFEEITQEAIRHDHSRDAGLR